MGIGFDRRRATLTNTLGGIDMIVRIESGLIELHETGDLKKFRVDAVASTPAALERTLADAGAGRLDGEHVWVDPRFVTDRLPNATAQFAADFTAMLDYAGQHGYLAPDGFIRAHVAWL